MHYILRIILPSHLLFYSLIARSFSLFSLQEEHDESYLLARAFEEMKRNIYLTKRGFDQGNTVAALAAASQVIQHLRTSKLGPNAYYELWMKVTDALREAEYNFDELDALDRKGEGGQSVMELYENVQHCGNIIPRLYLLITVASTYIKSKRAPSKDVLFDLVELCRGVQHPMRGLFLRSYLSQMAKDKLPDVGSEYEGNGGNVKDAIEFILQNFAEMNKLWVRMQHQGAQRDRAKREKERRNLRQLVGTNLVRLSGLVGLTMQMYREEVLPRILEQIVNCKDVIAQEYLMDCIIQVFSDEFHLDTLEIYLSSCSQLQEKVNVKDILITLMNRLATFARAVIDGTAQGVVASSGKTGSEMFQHMFPLFSDYSARILKLQPNMALADVLSLLVSQLKFVSVVYPDRLDYVDQILEQASQHLHAAGGSAASDNKCVRFVIDLLTYPLELKLRFLQLTKYKGLLAFLARPQRKQVASAICTSLLEARVQLADVGTVHALFQLLQPLLKDDPADKDPEIDRFELEQEQFLVARLFHLIESPDVDTQFKIYVDVRKYFGQGGTARIEYTLPPMVYGAMKLAERAYLREEGKGGAEGAVSPSSSTSSAAGDDVDASSPTSSAAAGVSAGDGKVKAKRVFSFIHETIGVLMEPYPELALRLFLQTAYVADSCNYEVIAYEFAAQAFITFETEVADSKAQFAAINYIVAALGNFKNFNKENYETLVSKATQHSARLLAKPDQCRSVYNCAHMFWPASPNHVGRDEKRVLQCLQRSLKIASTCMGNHTHLFVEILNKYLYFFEKGCPSIEAKHLKGLIALIDENMSSVDGAQAQIAAAHYQNTVALIEAKQVLAEDRGDRAAK